MEIQVVCEPESDGCNLRGDQSSDFNSTSDVIDHKASIQFKMEEDWLTPSCLNRKSDEPESYQMGFSANSHCRQEKLAGAGLPKTSTYWRQQNPSTPGVYVRDRTNYNLRSEDKGMEHHYSEYSKDLQDQREEENFIILVDSFEDENIPPQLEKALPYQYKKVGKSFQVVSKLQKVHGAERSYRCPLCGKEFFRAANLRMHKLIHVKERPHKCPICNKGFIRTADVWRHLHSLHKIDRSSVVLDNENTRNQWFAQKENQDGNWEPEKLSSATSSLGQGNSKQYPCPTCNKSFRKSNLLSKHRVIHRTEKPYKCKECGMAFVQSARLKRHNLTHTGEHPFSCEECSSTFTRLGSLQRHQRIHTGEKPYCCGYCRKTFKDSGTLRKHEERHRVIKT